MNFEINGRYNHVSFVTRVLTPRNFFFFKKKSDLTFVFRPLKIRIFLEILTSCYKKSWIRTISVNVVGPCLRVKGFLSRGWRMPRVDNWIKHIIPDTYSEFWIYSHIC